MAEAATDHGKTLLSWDFPEFVHYQRSRTWFTWAFLVAAGLITWALIQQNVLFAIIILIVTTILFANSRRHPGRITFTVLEDGVNVGHAFYPFTDLKTFWLFYKPPEVKKLYLHFKTSVRPSLVIPIEQTDPLALRTMLQKYLTEDMEQEDEPATDELARILKI